MAERFLSSSLVCFTPSAFSVCTEASFAASWSLASQSHFVLLCGSVKNSCSHSTLVNRLNGDTRNGFFFFLSWSKLTDNRHWMFQCSFPAAFQLHCFWFPISNRSVLHSIQRRELSLSLSLLLSMCVCVHHWHFSTEKKNLEIPPKRASLAH